MRNHCGLRRVLTFAAVGVAASVLAAPGGAANTFNVTILLAADLRANPCTPTDVVNFHGTLHMVMHVTEDSQGGYHLGMEKNWVLGGASILTGVEYRGSQTSTKSVYVRAGTSTTTTDDVHLISQAGTDDFIMHSNMRITVDTAGVPTVVVDNTWFDCKG